MFIVLPPIIGSVKVKKKEPVLELFFKILMRLFFELVSNVRTFYSLVIPITSTPRKAS